MDKHEDLTRAERRFLERVAEAQEHGVTLEQYYRSSGLSVGWLYNIRRQLEGKGVVVPEPSARSAAVTSGKFVEVCVRAGTESAASAVCRVRHPSGWILECAIWPEVSWVRQLLGEGP